MLAKAERLNVFRWKMGKARTGSIPSHVAFQVLFDLKQFPRAARSVDRAAVVALEQSLAVLERHP